MDNDTAEVARRCLAAAQGGSMAFPAIVGALMSARFESYLVDYRANTATYYLTYGNSVPLDNGHPSGQVAPAFDEAAIAGQVRWAQADADDFSYATFSRNVVAAGCAGYLVSFPGRRVVYFGRTAEVHVEHFPQ